MLLTIFSDEIEAISLDHDLGQDPNGYDVAKFIEEGAFTGWLKPIEINIHSANPVGCRNMSMARDSAYRFWQVSG